MKKAIVEIGKKSFLVYEDGTVYNQRNHKLSHYKRPNGYIYVEVVVKEKEKRKKIALHRLVAQAFLPNPNNLPEVNHKDGNPLNNHVANLEWVTGSQNQYHSRYILKNESGFKNTPVYCKELKKSYSTTREAWRDTGVNYSHISECANGKRKTAGGYHWERVGD